jgi:hypothetical protein
MQKIYVMPFGVTYDLFNLTANFIKFNPYELTRTHNQICLLSLMVVYHL